MWKLPFEEEIGLLKEPDLKVEEGCFLLRTDKQFESEQELRGRIAELGGRQQPDVAIDGMLASVEKGPGFADVQGSIEQVKGCYVKPVFRMGRGTRVLPEQRIIAAFRDQECAQAAARKLGWRLEEEFAPSRLEGERVFEASLRLDPSVDPFQVERDLAAQPGVLETEVDVTNIIPDLVINEGCNNYVEGFDPYAALGFTPNRQELSGVRVSLLDTGVCADHPLLPDIESKSFIPPEAPGRRLEHGTKMAGIIASKGGNGLPRGIAAGCTLKSAQIMTHSHQQSCWLLKGLQWACKDADVVSMSLTICYSPAVARHLDSNEEAIFVASTGNEGKTYPVSFPASHPKVVAVAASDWKSQVKSNCRTGGWGSNYQGNVDLVAPGVNYRTTTNCSSWLGGIQGTSPAAAAVAACVARLRAIQPSLKRDDVISLLKDTREGVPHANWAKAARTLRVSA